MSTYYPSPDNLDYEMKMEKKLILSPRYAGEGSKSFWDLIDNIKDESKRQTAYHIAVELQETEARTLKLLEDNIL